MKDKVTDDDNPCSESLVCWPHEGRW